MQSKQNPFLQITELKLFMLLTLSLSLPLFLSQLNSLKSALFLKRKKAVHHWQTISLSLSHYHTSPILPLTEILSQRSLKAYLMH